MFLSVIIQRIKDKVCYEINKRTWRNRQDTFLSAIDLMQPINGKIMAAHLIIVSRMLDIELIREGKRSWWDVRMNSSHKNLSEDVVNAIHSQFDGIVKSMDIYGWDYNLSSVYVNRIPFFIYNGTHRCAYSLLQNPYQMIPISINNDAWDWTYDEGVEYLREIGMKQDEIDTLLEKYYALLDKYNRDYLIITTSLSKGQQDTLSKGISKFGTITKIENITLKYPSIPEWFTNVDKYFVVHEQGKELSIIKFKSTNKDIYCCKGIFGSKKIEEALKAAGIKNYIYTPTITKSIEMEIWLKENCK